MLLYSIPKSLHFYIPRISPSAPNMRSPADCCMCAIEKKMESKSIYERYNLAT